MITTEKIGRRTYLNGNTYAHRDLMRSKGCTWDPDKKAWWTGSTEKAAEIVAEIGTTSTEKRSEKLDEHEKCLTGKAEYKGKTYYLTGAITRDGNKQMLAFLDGSAKFWADRSLVRTLKAYQSPKSLASLRSFAASVKEHGQLEEGYYFRKGEVLASGCSECSRRGTMCPRCYHDYE